MAAHSSILAWKVQWTEEPGRLQSKGSQRVRHDWETKHVRTHTHTHAHTHKCSYSFLTTIHFEYLLRIKSDSDGIQKKLTKRGRKNVLREWFSFSALDINKCWITHFFWLKAKMVNWKETLSRTENCQENISAPMQYSIFPLPHSSDTFNVILLWSKLWGLLMLTEGDGGERRCEQDRGEDHSTPAGAPLGPALEL